jgi:hypothetical protein
MPNTLRFKARGTSLVQNFERLEAGIKSFLGRKYVQLAPPANPKDQEDIGQWAFVPTDEVAVVPFRAEYVKACKDGDLYAADAETAKACGVEFDPSFGEPAPEWHDAKTST